MPQIIDKITILTEYSGIVDDYEIIGGYKVVQKYVSDDSSEITLTTLKTNAKKKKNLTHGSPVYVATGDEKGLYRWNSTTQDFVKDESGGGGLNEEDLQNALNSLQFKNLETNNKSIIGAINEANSNVGQDGKSAYDIWLEEGNEGTQEEFLESLKGTTGAKIIKTEWVGKDANGGNIYRQTFDDGSIAEFVVPQDDSNIERGSGDGAFQQQGGKAIAAGKGSVALNGGYKVEEDGTETEGVRANGEWSIAGGRDNVAYQTCAVVFGKGCIAGMSATDFSEKYPDGVDDWGDTYEESWSLANAEGLETWAKGRNSHAQNRGTQALANDSSASGVETVASGENGSNANGFKTKATGTAAFTANYQTTASAIAAAAFGMNNEASEEASFVIGKYNISKGANACVEGQENTAISWNSHAGGYQSTASQPHSFVYGRGLQSRNTAQTVVGSFNDISYTIDWSAPPMFTVGCGTSKDDRKDAFIVLRDGRAKVKTAPQDPDDVLRKGDLGDGVKNLPNSLTLTDNEKEKWREMIGAVAVESPRYLHTITYSPTELLGIEYTRQLLFESKHSEPYTSHIYMDNDLRRYGGRFVKDGTTHFLTSISGSGVIIKYINAKGEIEEFNISKNYIEYTVELIK